MHAPTFAMNGWTALVVIALLVGLTLWRSGVARPLWTLVGAALLLGATGYAVQEHAALSGHPVAPDADPVIVDPATVDLRGAMLGRFSGDGAYLIMSDALMRRGSRQSGANVVLFGVGNYKRSLTLWTGLGTALAQHDGSVSPAARLAFDQATRLAPEHPAPPYFRGLAYAETGDYAAARRYWRHALALSPPGASYRRDIAEQLATLDALIAQ